MRPFIIACMLCSGTAFADGDYCPEDVNYTLEVVADEIWITHLNHPAFCKLQTVKTYECKERYADGDVSVYSMEAEETPDGLLYKIEGWESALLATLC